MVVAQVFLYEGGNEIVAVVITLVAAQGQRLRRFRASLLQQVRVQLFGQKFVGQSLVHQNALRKQGR